MPSHYSTIGFDVSSPEELEQLAGELRKMAVAVATRYGTYYRWSSASGAEVWLQMGRRGELVGAHPHFSSGRRTPLVIEKRVRRADQSIMDGAYSGRGNPADDESIGVYPLVIDCANFRVVAETPLPAVATVQIAAFAYELWAFESAEHFAEAQTGEVKFASRSFVSSSAFDDDAGSAAEAFFCGHVLAAGARTNEMTRREFHWACVETYGATFDVVWDPDLLPTIPAVGGVIQGTFWLSGYIETIESRAGMLKKLLWRLRNAG